MTFDRAAWPFVGVLAVVGAAAAAWQPWAALPPALVAIFVLQFFRDPEREAPADPDALLSPADGRVILAGPRTVSIFMNVFDVHVCRSPAAGRVAAIRAVRGEFWAAWRDEASDHNERTEIELETDRGPVRFVLVAGLVARRIVCRVRPGASLVAGERLGIIRFGSRVDLDVPAGARVEVRVGQRVRAGESVIVRRHGAS